MTEANSALAGKVTSIERIAYRKLTDAPSRLTDGGKVEKTDLNPLCILIEIRQFE